MKTRLEDIVKVILLLACILFAIIGVHYSVHEKDILDESRTHGYEEGYEEGFNDGYDEGRMDGYQDGYDDGYEIAYDEAYYEGYQDGHAKGLRGME